MSPTFLSFDEDPDQYQRLLSSMVTSLSRKVDSRRKHLDCSETKQPYTGLSKLLKHENLIDKPSVAVVNQYNLLSSQLVAERPSQFGISLVDPLHFLGVKPTVESGYLLQACKS